MFHRPLNTFPGPGNCLLLQIDASTYSTHLGQNEIVVSLMGCWNQVLLAKILGAKILLGNALLAHIVR